MSFYNKRMLSDKSVQAILEKYTPSTVNTVQAINAVNRSAATMDAIKAYIMNHGLKPGDPLPTEAKLCADLGVSRSSVREALRRLEALDIVQVHQGRGSFVGDMSMEPLVHTLILRNALDQQTGQATLRQIVTTRRSLDLGIAQDLLKVTKGTENPELDALVDVMVEKARAGKTYIEEDIAFHSALVAPLHNELIAQLISAMWMVHQAFIPQMGEPGAKELLRTAKAHRDMLRAAEAGDLQAYQTAVYAHYDPLAKLIDLEESE